jgi:DNA (cytosine-5)-methyltransferase 1
MIDFIDLFAGIGGFRYGLESISLPRCSPQEEIPERQGLQVGRSLHSGWDEHPGYCCVWSNEWDRYANSVYKRHYQECDPRDVRTIKTNEIPDHQLLCAGFPCQSFSVAGKRRGFNETRGTLFFEIARILSDKRPEYLLLENVKGLLSHDAGETIQVMFRVLTDLGYDCEWQVLNSKDFAIPQNRERVFIIGHLRTEPVPKVLPITPDDRQVIEVWNKVGQERRDSGDVESQNGRSTERRKVSIRRFTPLETERLQGFPDNWTQFGVQGELISDTQRYRMTGNAVTTSIIKVIGEKLWERLNRQ